VIPIPKNEKITDLCKQIEHDYSQHFPDNSAIKCTKVCVRECFEIYNLKMSIQECFDDFMEITVTATNVTKTKKEYSLIPAFPVYSQDPTEAYSSRHFSQKDVNERASEGTKEGCPFQARDLRNCL